MDSRRNKVLAVSLGALIILSAALAWWGRGEDRRAVDRQMFAIAETDKINRVTLVRATDSVDLVFEGSRWMVNGTWAADLQMIKVLMATLRQIEPHRPVAASQVDTVNAQLTAAGTRVTVSFSDGTQQTFTAGGNRAKTEAWMRKEGEDAPYSMIIPGYRVYVSGVFELDAGGWRNKRVFDFNWRNFKSLTASYPRDPSAGFVVEMKQRFFGIRDMAAVDTTRLNDYLDAVSLLFARRFLSDQPTAQDPPVVRIEILDIADRTYTLELFAPRPNDAEVVGRLGDGQWLTFDPPDVEALLRRRSYFTAPD